MNKDKWNEIYEVNKELDMIFYQKYGNSEDIYRKNCIELLVELGEFVNETKVFKYWTVKSPDKEKMLEEYADNLTMCLYFFREFKLEIDDRYLHINSSDKLDIINYLYSKISLLINNKDKELIKDIFGNLLYLGSLLDFTEEEIINAIKNKHEIIRKRLNSNY